MSKLKSAVLYEYLTKVRAIGIFYLIQYLIVALIFAIVAICTEGKETGSNTLEFSSVVCKRKTSPRKGTAGYQGIRQENQNMSATGASPRNASTASPTASRNASSVIQEQVE